MGKIPPLKYDIKKNITIIKSNIAINQKSDKAIVMLPYHSGTNYLLEVISQVAR